MIQAEQLTRSYGDFRAVQRVSFEIGKGEVVGLLGHNGAGKTTIMKMLTGFLEPSSGSIRVDGIDIDQDRRAVQRKIGYLPENCPIYLEMTVIDYLEYQAGLHGIPPGASRNAAVRRAIERTRLEEKAMEPIANLSRGYRQRVGVAQALLHEPQILILDEPTNGLDPSQIQQMRELIAELSKQATVILSTHILQEVQAVCDRVLIIRRGELALDARLADLRSGRRLLVSVDGGPEKVSPLLKGINEVTGVEHLGMADGRHRYALASNQETSGGDPSAIAPQVARALLDNGLALYGLQPEQRDLETLFREVNAVQPTEVTRG